MYCGDSRSTQSSFLGGLRRSGRADDGGALGSALGSALGAALGSALGSAAAALVVGRAPSDRTEVRKALDEASSDAADASDASDAFASPAVPSFAAASAPLMMPVRCHQVADEAAADPLPNLDRLPVVAAPAAPAAPAPTPRTPTTGGLAAGARAVLCAANGRLPSGDRISPPKLHKT